jgi:hypothetical protein
MIQSIKLNDKHCELIKISSLNDVELTKTSKLLKPVTPPRHNWQTEDKDWPIKKTNSEVDF